MENLAKGFFFLITQIILFLLPIIVSLFFLRIAFLPLYSNTFLFLFYIPKNFNAAINFGMWLSFEKSIGAIKRGGCSSPLKTISAL